MVDEIKNWFAGQDVARLYRARPYHHARTLARVFEDLGMKVGGDALDIGCGTGMSSIGLAEHVDSVVGIDPVIDMLHVARRTRNVTYVAASAEDLPFRDRTLAGITVSSAVHWFDQDRFFAEAERVLASEGWLLLYDHHFAAQMEGNSAFQEWMYNSYGRRYPPPTRRAGVSDAETPPSARPWRVSDAALDVVGFTSVGTGQFDDPIPMDHQGFVSYLLTHSNTISVVESGRERREEIRSWLERETAPFFEPAEEARTLLFRGTFICLRRAG